MAKVKVNRVLIDPKFIGDVCRRCDKWMAEIKSHHGIVTSDVIYKCSAAWKDYPIQYAYTGDMGGSAKLSFAPDATEIDRCVSSDYFRYLLGASDVMWEMGLTLHFGDDGKHSARYHSVEVLVDEDDI